MITISDDTIKFLSGGIVISILAHAVNTFPTPKNPYGQWILGTIRYMVGQRITAINTLNGLQSEVTAVTTEQKKQLTNGSTMQVVKTAEGILKPLEIKNEKT